MTYLENAFIYKDYNVTENTPPLICHVDIMAILAKLECSVTCNLSKNVCLVEECNDVLMLHYITQLLQPEQLRKY